MINLRRSPTAVVAILGFLAIVVFGLAGVAEDISVSDELLQTFIAAPDGTLTAMQDFVTQADALYESNPEVRAEMLADPHGWILDNYGIEVTSAVFWTVDLMVPPPLEGAAWLFDSPYLGDGALLPPAIVLSGPELALFIQVPESATPATTTPMSLTQRYLEIIGGRPDSELNNLQAIVLDMNSRASEEEVTLFKEETRRALLNYNQRMSAGETRLLVVDIPLGMSPDYNAVHFGLIPDGTILAPAALAYIGDTCVICFNVTL